MSCNGVFSSSSKLRHKITISHWHLQLWLKTLNLRHDLSTKNQPFQTSILPRCLCKILSKSPLKKPRYKHTFKNAPQASFRLIKRIYSFPRGHKSASALSWFHETLSSFVLTKKYSSAYTSTGCALKVVKFIFKKVVICTEILLVLPFASSERYISKYLLDSRKTLYFLISAGILSSFRLKSLCDILSGEYKTNELRDWKATRAS